MYELQRRYKLSLVIPALLTIVYVLKLIQALTNQGGAQSPTTTAVIINILNFALEVVIVYIFSVVFFSIETLIRSYITDTDSPESMQFKAEFATVPLSQKLKVLEKRDLVTTENKITRSVIFQVALMAFGFYAVTSSSGVIGIGITLSILLQMLFDQWTLLQKTHDLSSWFWQIKTNVARDLQQLYMGGVAVLFLVLLAFLLR